MSQAEKRRFTRVTHQCSPHITHLNGRPEPQSSVAQTQNISASGIKLITANSLEAKDFVLVDASLEDLDALVKKNTSVLRLGKKVFSRVVWSKPTPDQKFEIGIDFIDRTTCSQEEFEAFTQLINLTALSGLPC